jgi:hypothetical protein
MPVLFSAIIEMPPIKTLMIRHKEKMIAMNFVLSFLLRRLCFNTLAPIVASSYFYIRHKKDRPESGNSTN